MQVILCSITIDNDLILSLGLVGVWVIKWKDTVVKVLESGKGSKEFLKSTLRGIYFTRSNRVDNQTGV